MRYTPIHAPYGAHATRATRGEGCTAPLIRKDPAAASYGCAAGAGRDNVAEGGEERYNARSTFETSKYNSYNILLKAAKSLEICF
jgi:hypothetical protein